MDNNMIEKISVTCDASGDAAVYTRPVNGLLYGIKLQKGTSSIANTSDVTISTVDDFPLTIITLTNLDITSTSAQYYPRVASCGATGTANSDTNTLIPVNGRIKVVVAQGGNGGQVDIWFSLL